MLNQIILIGRLTKDPEIRMMETGKKVCEATLAVRRPFKNDDGKYDTDFVPVTMWDGLAQNFQMYAEKGSLVAVKGRIQPHKYEINEEKHIMSTKIVCERVSFL